MGESAEDPRNWRGLYKAALFETDTSKLAWRIEEARKALIFRSRELFKTSPNYAGETEAIEAALYALQALENCLRSNTKDRRHSPSRLDCSQTTRMPCRWDKIAVSSLVVGVDKHISFAARFLFKDHTSPSAVSWFCCFLLNIDHQ